MDDMAAARAQAHNSGPPAAQHGRSLQGHRSSSDGHEWRDLTTAPRYRISEDGSVDSFRHSHGEHVRGFDFPPAVPRRYSGPMGETEARRIEPRAEIRPQPAEYGGRPVVPLAGSHLHSTMSNSYTMVRTEDVDRQRQRPAQRRVPDLLYFKRDDERLHDYDLQQSRELNREPPPYEALPFPSGQISRVRFRSGYETSNPLPLQRLPSLSGRQRFLSMAGTTSAACSPARSTPRETVDASIFPRSEPCERRHEYTPDIARQDQQIAPVQATRPGSDGIRRVVSASGAEGVAQPRDSIGSSDTQSESHSQVDTPTPPPRKKKKRNVRICTTPGCDKLVVDRGVCIRHGGGKRCNVEGCECRAQNKGLCWKHGGYTICRVDGCAKRAKSRGMCWTHGGGTKCQTDGCERIAVSRSHCWAHGGGKRCKVAGCKKPAALRMDDFCSEHHCIYGQQANA